MKGARADMELPLTHLLDTSALIAHFREEAGWEVVDALIADEAHGVRICSVSWLEFRNRLYELTPDAEERSGAMQIYRALLGEGIPTNDAIAHRAHLLRQTAKERLPNMDALIAATAAEHGAVLVHRDPHMAGIPTASVSQLVLPDKSSAAKS